ncbi:LysR family transcriptional regulator [Mesorhizobium sp. 1M-11]|uniref:LysR family transcriptional regulator n=1 Tax=Mesorhizobium sp. 1M-11 TaxID=1529006 RepID=UPI0006C75039|nr:LysR family transcriptional regulator [Mesorhizobium sp. 1M-11]
MIDPAVLHLIPTFRVVAQCGGFTAASGRLGVSASAVSQTIKKLEELIGVRLFERTSRSLRLTDSGEEFLQSIGQPLDQIESAIDMLSNRAGLPAGVLRVTLSRLAAKTCILDRMVEFVQTYPGVTLELSTDDRLVDIVAGGFDVGIRMRETLENDMIARPIGIPLRRSLLASKAYASRHGVPSTVDDFANHRFIRYRFPRSERLAPLEFGADDQLKLVDPNPFLVLDDDNHISTAVRAGLGIAQRYRQTEEDAIDSGELIEIMPRYEPSPVQFFAYYPSRRQQPAKLAVFLDWFCGRARSQ